MPIGSARLWLVDAAICYNRGLMRTWDHPRRTKEQAKKVGSKVEKKQIKNNKGNTEKNSPTQRCFLI